MGTYIVKNIKGTSDTNFPSGSKSWLEYWEKNNGSIDGAFLFNEINCTELATQGLHVQLQGGTNEWYIVPLCVKHNNPHNTSTMQVNGPLVPVNSTLRINQ